MKLTSAIVRRAWVLAHQANYGRRHGSRIFFGWALKQALLEVHGLRFELSGRRPKLAQITSRNKFDQEVSRMPIRGKAICSTRPGDAAYRYRIFPNCIYEALDKDGLWFVFLDGHDIRWTTRLASAEAATGACL